MGHDARRRVTSQDCRIDHPEDHRHVGHHEEGRHHRHVHPQTVLTTAAQDPRLEETDHEHGQATDQVAEDRDDISRAAPSPIHGQGHHRVDHQVRPDEDPHGTGEQASSPTEPRHPRGCGPVIAAPQQHDQFRDRQGLGQDDREGHEQQQVPRLPHREKFHVVGHRHASHARASSQVGHGQGQPDRGHAGNSQECEGPTSQG